jgi:fructose-bisphosphate aldolase class II
MKKICVDRYEAFGCSGNASKIKTISLFDMTDKYKNGELDPVVN